MKAHIPETNPTFEQSVKKVLSLLDQLKPATQQDYNNLIQLHSVTKTNRLRIEKQLVSLGISY